MLKADWKERWIEALRSGKHRQAQNELLVANGAKCCLGVLRYVGDPKDRSCEAGGGRLNGQQLHRFGLAYGQQIELIRMNDSGKTFAEIADYIERKL